MQTKLELPEYLKKRMDIHFASDRELRQIGKNTFMVEAIKTAVKKLDDAHPLREKWQGNGQG